MTQIKIEVPSNDPIALSALGEALQRIASERASSPIKRRDAVLNSVRDLQPVQQASADLPQTVKFENTTTEEQHNENMLADQMESFETPKNDDYVEELSESATTLANQVNQLHEQVDASGDVEVPDTLPTDDTLDADGLPWDKRIHSRGKTRLADDTWRLARKPNDKTQEEWDEYVASVKAELKAVQDIPAPSDTMTPPVVDEPQAEVDAGNLTPPVVETETVTPPVIDEPATQLEGVTPNGDSGSQVTGEPVPAVEPPTSVTAPAVDNTPSVSTFQELMKYITSDAAKRGATNYMIKEVLAQVDPSLTAIPLIANRADLIPSFVAKLEAKLS